MPDKDKSLSSALRHAHQSDQIGYARYLGELYLQEHPDDGPWLISHAIDLISLAQYDLANEALDHAEAVVPQDYLDLVVAQRGHILRAKGDFPAAEEIYMRAHILDPEDAQYLIYAGSIAFEKGEISRAIALTRQAIKCAEGCIDEAYFNLGGYLLSNCEYREAADCYRKALEIDPDYEIAKERLADVELILAHIARLR